MGCEQSDNFFVQGEGREQARKTEIKLQSTCRRTPDEDLKAFHNGPITSCKDPSFSLEAKIPKAVAVTTRV